MDSARDSNSDRPLHEWNSLSVNRSTRDSTYVWKKKELLREKHKQLTINNNNKVSVEDQPHEPLDAAARQEYRNLECIMHILLDPISVLLVFWPLGFCAHFFVWGDTAGFWLNFLAMIPLAKILGDFTEELASALKNDTVGGLLNATFGNAVEMILTVQTLRVGEVNVVKGTLLGSILSNLLLVLGMSFFFGGIRNPDGGWMIKGKQQFFSVYAALTNFTMLFLASCAFALPTVFFSTHSFHENNSDLTLGISRWCSIYILLAYLAFLLFQLYTHVEIFRGPQDEDEDEDEASLSPYVASFLLFLATVFVSLSSEWLVASIDGLVEEWHMGKSFVGVILLPIVGNACEHAGAVRMAMVEKVDITLGIAVGSSTQIALFVVPFAVLAGWVIDQPMDLNFGQMNTTVMFFSVLIAFSICTDGSSNWLEGFMLMIAYATVATLYFFAPNEE